ncbi:MAG: hypothetical protein ABEI78_01090 [Candidatus Nanohaloarchaea archaeon]
MTEIDEREARQILREAEQTIQDSGRIDNEILDLREKADKLREQIEEQEVDKDRVIELKNLIEDIDEGEDHQEPEMTPEEDREAREEGSRDEEYN